MSDIFLCDVLKTDWAEGPGLLLRDTSTEDPQCHPTNCHLSKEFVCP